MSMKTIRLPVDHLWRKDTDTPLEEGTILKFLAKDFDMDKQMDWYFFEVIGNPVEESLRTIVFE